MHYLREYLLGTLTAMTAERKANNRFPYGIDMIDIQHKVTADIKAVLNELCRDKVIEHYKTINSVAFKMKPGQEQ